jgi:hypothetical protein
VSISRRARASTLRSFGIPSRDSRSHLRRTSHPLTGGPYGACTTFLCVGFRLRSPSLSSFFATRRFATSGRRASFDARHSAGRLDHVPARSDRRLPRTTSLVRGARRARPPPFVPHGTASAFSVLLGTAAGDASGHPACCAGTTGHAWGAARRRPRSIRPMSAAHGFCSQRTFWDDAQVSMHAAAQFPRAVGALGFTP